MESRKSVMASIDDFIIDLIQNHNPGEDCVTSISFSPYIFEKLLEERVPALSGKVSSDNLKKCKELNLFAHTGRLIIKKDVSKIIKRKQNQVDTLLKDIEELKK